MLKNPVTSSPKSSGSQKSSIPTFESIGYRLGTAEDNEREKINRTIAEFNSIQVPTNSKQKTNPRERIIPITIEDNDNVKVKTNNADDDDEDLRRALQLSLQDTGASGESLNHLHNNTEVVYDIPDDNDSEDELRRALQLSLECNTVSSTPDPDDLRLKRLAYLGIHSST